MHTLLLLAGSQCSQLETPVEGLSSSQYLLNHQNALLTAATRFVEKLRTLQGEAPDKFSAIVYFDEAHTLQCQMNSKIRNPYFCLHHVLNTITELPICFIFLSTNSSLQAFVPTNALFPSIQVQQGLDLIPPFFELPFDTFCSNFTSAALDAHDLTLTGVCKLKHMAKFGRPL